MNTRTNTASLIQQAICSWQRTPLLLLLLLLPGGLLFAVEINTEQVEKNHKLETIRTQIKHVESNIESAKKNITQLFSELQQQEVAAGDTAIKIQHLQTQVAEKNAELQELQDEQQTQEAFLQQQREQLGRQVRNAYKTGRHNYLKLLLNQQHPEQVGRMMAYYHYDVEARSRRIADINTTLTRLAELRLSIEAEKLALTQLHTQQQQKLEEFQRYRASRQKISDELQAYISAQGAQLQVLQGNEKELSSLVDELKQQQLAIQVYEDMPPFTSLRGKLKWPVQGKISSRFGSLRKGGKLKWQGVTINAGSGVEVHAISTGKVVFADWFRNMGLLIILDHGDGYMSLYGHNARLLKKSGDWVVAGDLIAHVGDTGGQQQAGLYFEIRQSGNPVNPNLWCKN